MENDSSIPYFPRGTLWNSKFQRNMIWNWGVAYFQTNPKRGWSTNKRKLGGTQQRTWDTIQPKENVNVRWNGVVGRFQLNAMIRYHGDAMVLTYIILHPTSMSDCSHSRWVNVSEINMDKHDVMDEQLTMAANHWLPMDLTTANITGRTPQIPIQPCTPGMQII